MKGKIGNYAMLIKISTAKQVMMMIQPNLDDRNSYNRIFFTDIPNLKVTPFFYENSGYQNESSIGIKALKENN